MDDGGLLLLAREGDLAALGQIYDRHAATVYSRLMARGMSSASAADLLEAAFCRLVDPGFVVVANVDIGQLLTLVALSRAKLLRTERTAATLVATVAAALSP